MILLFKYDQAHGVCKIKFDLIYAVINKGIDHRIKYN